MVAGKRNPVSVDAYLAMERASAERHVLWDGEVFARQRALPDHNTITANVSQTERYVEHFARQGDGSWSLREYHGDARVPVAALDGALPLEELYLKVFG